MSATTLFAATFLLLGVVLLALLLTQLWRLVVEDDGRLRFAEMLERRGASLPSGELGLTSVAYATRRCVFCAQKRECDAWLGTGLREGAGAFCPNSELVERLARR